MKKRNGGPLAVSGKGLESGEMFPPNLRERLELFIARKVQDPSLAEDLAQNTLSKVILKQSQLRDKKKFWSWATAIARNEINIWARKEKSAKLSRLYEEALQSPQKTKPDLFKSFDEVIEKISRAEPDPSNVIPLALHFVFGWSVKDVAAITGISVETMKSRMKKTRDRMRKAPDAPANEAASLGVKNSIMAHLWNAAMNPTQGPDCRNRELAKLALDISRITALQHPDNPHAQASRIIMTLSMAQLEQYPDDQSSPFRDWKDWDRNKWNKALLHEGGELFEKFKSMLAPPELSALAQFYSILLLPNKNDSDRWRRAFEKIEEYIRVKPQSNAYLSAARALAMLKGHSVAAKYLEAVKENPFLKHMPQYYSELGWHYSQSGQVALAKKSFRKALKWSMNDCLKNQIIKTLR